MGDETRRGGRNTFEGHEALTVGAAVVPLEALRRGGVQCVQLGPRADSIGLVQSGKPGDQVRASGVQVGNGVERAVVLVEGDLQAGASFSHRRGLVHT